MALSEKEAKLWRLALDPAAGEGEICNAAIALIRSLRQRHVSAYDQASQPNTQSPKHQPPPQRPPTPENYWDESNWPGAIIMPWGKWKGHRLAEIDPGYLEWCVDNFEDTGRNRRLLQAMEWCLEDLDFKRNR